ncbi:MAG: D-alanine--D-alanine ligase, partial [Candidatus Aureabacteria bacterium]|nr:D-alanine--D-alanine ligase [Candidatus Auribacterota bacterium]
KKGKKCTPALDAGKGHILDLQNKKPVRIDAFFPVLHGTYGEDGTIQGLFEMMNIPYVGCSVLGSAAGMDKDVMKRLFWQRGLPVVKWMTFYDNEDPEKIKRAILKNFRFPVFVKPVNLGSSVGISRVENRRQILGAVREAFLYDFKIIIEQGYDIREIECSVLGNFRCVTSQPGEIVPHGDSFYSYKAKYENTGSELFIPAKLDQKTARKIRDYAVRAFQALEGKGMARVDFFVTKKGNRIFVNELNTIPGFTSISMFPKMFEKSGLKYPRLIDKLFRLALEIHKKRNSKKYSH